MDNARGSELAWNGCWLMAVGWGSGTRGPVVQLAACDTSPGDWRCLAARPGVGGVWKFLEIAVLLCCLSACRRYLVLSKVWPPHTQASPLTHERTR